MRTLLIILFSVSFEAYAFLPTGHIEQKKFKVVELQWDICEPVAVVFKKLQVNPDKTADRNVYYRETPDLIFNSHKAAIRIREGQSKRKSAVKLSYDNPSDVPWDFLKGKDFKCEKGTHKGREKLSCSLSDSLNQLDDQLSQDQIEFIEMQFAKKDLKRTLLLGPAQSEEWEWTDARYAEDFVLERVSYGSNYTSIELSLRTDIDSEVDTFEEIDSWLSERKIILCPQQGNSNRELLKQMLVSAKLFPN